MKLIKCKILFCLFLCVSYSIVTAKTTLKIHSIGKNLTDNTKSDTSHDTVKYNWKNVQMVGGGFIDGIIFHPTAKGVCYCRTDIAGAYRWNGINKRWEPLMDWVSYKDNNLMGVESIALDPNEPDKLYMACGTYTSSKGPNAIFRSLDRGRTFQRTDVPFKMGGNENGRGNGERMAVDPNNGNVIYMGTRLDGLWVSDDAAVSWHKVESFNTPQNIPLINNPVGKVGRNRSVGIVFVVFDGSGSRGRNSAGIYAGVSVKGQSNLICSTDAGLTWHSVAGQPTQFVPTHAVMASNGELILSYGTNAGPDAMTNGAVYKLNTRTGEWTDITPVKPEPENQKAFGYAAVAVDAHNPNAIIGSSFNRYGKAGGEDVFRTVDGGQTWKPIFTGPARGMFDNSIAPYVAHTGIHWLFDIEIDPVNPDHALFTTGYGGHETFNLTDADKGKPTLWSNMCPGIEETVVLDMVSPAKGPSLISAIGDYGGFVHWDLDKVSSEGNFTNPHFSNTTGIACAAENPDIVVRVGIGSTQVGGGNIGYSINGGKNWMSVDKTPGLNARGGHVSVSADGIAWIWSPENGPAYATADLGKTWLPVSGLPQDIPIVADMKDVHSFYAVDVAKLALLKSIDGGVTFTRSALNIINADIGQNNITADKREGTNQLYTTPNKAGDMWLVTLNGLYHSINGGGSFLKISDMRSIRAFGFGKSATADGYPVLYLVSTLNGLNMVYRSEDQAQNWIRINDDQHQWGTILRVSGDPKVYGRVYIGTHGRGIVYGYPVKTN